MSGLSVTFSLFLVIFVIFAVFSEILIYFVLFLKKTWGNLGPLKQWKPLKTAVKQWCVRKCPKLHFFIKKQWKWQNPDIPHSFTVRNGEKCSFDMVHFWVKKVVFKSGQKWCFMSQTVTERSLVSSACDVGVAGDGVPSGRCSGGVPGYGVVRGRGRSLVHHRGTGPGHLSHCNPL